MVEATGKVIVSNPPVRLLMFTDASMTVGRVMEPVTVIGELAAAGVETTHLVPSQRHERPPLVKT